MRGYPATGVFLFRVSCSPESAVASWHMRTRCRPEASAAFQ